MNINNKFRILISISAFFLLSNIAIAAEKVTLGINKTFAGITAEPSIQGLDSQYTFRPSKRIELENGKIRFKHTQFFRDIPVWDATVVSNKEDVKKVGMGMLGNGPELKGTFLANIEDDIQTTKTNISEFQAKETAISTSKVTDTQKVENFNTKLFIKNYNDVAKIVYVTDFYYADDENPRRPYAIIDATTGEVLEKWEGLSNEFGAATGPGGNAKVGKYFYGKDYGSLIVNISNNTCSMDSPNVATYDLDHKKYDKSEADTGGVLYSFNCPDNADQEVNGGYSAVNDAHYFGNVVYDLYKAWYNIAPLKFKIKMKVHSGVNFGNAFFNGKEMIFGDGNKKLYPLVAADIVGHEISHGFTEQNSGLTYRDQSGAINESFSDIAGEATEYFLNINKPEDQRADYMVGESVIKGAHGKAIRYFDDPTRDGISLDNAKNYNADENEVHSSSGIFNKAFYILAHTPNWDLKKAFNVFVVANQLYWSADSTFETAACGVKTAAEDKGYSSADVIAAFKIVGVNATCEAQPEPTPAPAPTTPAPDTKPAPTPAPAPAPDNTPDPNPAPDFATKLTKAVSIANVSGIAGSHKIFYIDVKGDNVGILNTWLFSATNSPTITIAYDRLPTATNNDCDSKNNANTKTCTIKNPKAGRYFIDLTSDKDFDELTIWSSYL